MVSVRIEHRWRGPKPKGTTVCEYHQVWKRFYAAVIYDHPVVYVMWNRQPIAKRGLDEAYKAMMANEIHPKLKALWGIAPEASTMHVDVAMNNAEAEIARRAWESDEGLKH